MDVPAHVAAVLGYLPFVVALPAAVAVICNHIGPGKRHPAVLYASCGVMVLCIAFLLTRLPNSFFNGTDLSVAAVLAALCFVWPYLRATNVVTKRAAALLWRETFLFAFAGLCLCFVTWDWKTSGYGLLAALCLLSAVLLWRSSPLARYPLYAATLWQAARSWGEYITTCMIRRCCKSRFSCKSSAG